MKKLILIGAVFTSLAIKAADHETITVLQILKNNTEIEQFTVEKDTHIWNIQGYACPWPGIQIPKYIVQGDLVHHQHHMGDNERNFIIGVKNPNFEFCGIQDNNDLIVGEKLNLNINKKIEIVLIDSKWDETNISKVLQEVVTIKLKDRIYESTARVLLQQIPRTQKGQ